MHPVTGRFAGVAIPAVTLLLVVAGCGSGDGTVRQGPSRRRAGQEAALLSDAPIAQPLGSPFVAEAGSVWYADFRRLARYDEDSQRWSVRTFEFGPDELIGGLSFEPASTGGIVGVASTCVKPCDEGAARSLRAWQAAAAGGIRSLPIIGEAAIGPDAVLVPVPSDDGSVAFRLSDGGSTLVLRQVGTDLVGTRLDRPISLLCRSSGHYEAVAEVPDPGRLVPRRTVLRGADIDRLVAEDLPVAADRLLDGLDAMAVCLPAGVAIIGPNEAWEADRGAWRRVGSHIGESLRRQVPLGLPAVGRDGAIWVAGSYVDLKRSNDGWHWADRGYRRATSYASVSGVVVRYPDPASIPDVDVPSEPTEPTESGD